MPRIFERCKSLHSILVKSILYKLSYFFASHSLYIPFWLNLYNCTIRSLEGFFKLYIPFWLNLYSIRHSLIALSRFLYIPFWLNLYDRCIRGTTDWRQALHSILVKSIQAACDMSDVSIYFTFHSG